MRGLKITVEERAHVERRRGAIAHRSEIEPDGRRGANRF
jgi:hypothetical protein